MSSDLLSVFKSIPSNFTFWDIKQFCDVRGMIHTSKVQLDWDGDDHHLLYQWVIETPDHHDALKGELQSEFRPIQTVTDAFAVWSLNIADVAARSEVATNFFEAGWNFQ